MKKLLLSVLSLATLPLMAGEITTDAKDAQPLAKGAMVPSVTLHDVNSSKVELQEITKGKMTALIFYRGSWCPYCNKHLASMMEIEDELMEMGVQIIAVSPDKPEGLKDATEKSDLNYMLLSDSSADAIKAFGLAFKLDEKTREKYKDYGIDLEVASGENHYILPVPAVFLIDKSGTIQYVYANPDYSKRLAPKDLLEAVKAI